jgi:hypothetical protein
MSISAVNASTNNQYFMDYQKAHKTTATKATPKPKTALSNKTIDLKA